MFLYSSTVRIRILGWWTAICDNSAHIGGRWALLWGRVTRLRHCPLAPIVKRWSRTRPMAVGYRRRRAERRLRYTTRRGLKHCWRSGRLSRVGRIVFGRRSVVPGSRWRQSSLRSRLRRRAVLLGSALHLWWLYVSAGQGERNELTECWVTDGGAS